MERESCTVEYKQALTRSYLKTVSAFANYQTGSICFGITDDQERIGLSDPESAVLQIENQINDAIHPHPDFELKIAEDRVVILTVKKGFDTPYCYQGKAYKRNDSATVEVTPIEYKNLVLHSMHLTFTEIPSALQDLHFQAFESAFYNRFSWSAAFPDTWLTLGLWSADSGFNNAALLLSDQNSFPGMDVVIYGKEPNSVYQRISLANQSVLTLIEECVSLFEAHYVYESPSGLYRTVKETIPLSGFREVLLNAIVHREWQIPAPVRVDFYPESVTVTSPGGLPDGISQEEFLANRHISLLRNASLGFTFLRLGLIESLGSGIPALMDSYAGSALKPDFLITSNMISISLPVLKEASFQSDDQKTIYNLIKTFGPVSSSELQTRSQISKSTLQRNLKALMEQKLIQKSGRGPAVRYFLPR